MRFAKSLMLFAMILTVGIMIMSSPAFAWVINGEEQLFIPFWYDLEDAVCRYMIGWCP